MRIDDTFDIAGRGLVVAISDCTGLPSGRSLIATVTRPDGSQVTAEAFKESLLRKTTTPPEGEAFLLKGLGKADIPIGSQFAIRLADVA